MFLLTNCSIRITVSQADSQADLRTPDINRVMTSTTATHFYAMRVLSFLFIIAQSDTRNIENLISWYS